MYYSRYNVLVALKKYPQFSILHNLFHGQVSLVSSQLAEGIGQCHQDGTWSGLEDQDIRMLKEKKFVYDTEQEEERSVEELYRQLSDVMLQYDSTRQYQILLTYDCNLRCVYCFQRKRRDKRVMEDEKLDAIFNLIEEFEEQSKGAALRRGIPPIVPLISIVGGEPLLDAPRNRQLVSRIVDFVKAGGFDYAITTNGVHLSRFVSQFVDSGCLPKDCQVTLDGPERIHDKRRVRSDGRGSFEDIVAGVDRALSAGLSLSMRINMDARNIDTIEEIADLIVSREWDKTGRFTAYLAPVTDHSMVNAAYPWILSDKTLIAEIIRKFERSPSLSGLFQIKNFRGFSYVKRIVENTGLPVPTFWRCEALLGQMIFDPSGDVYSCFEGAGNDDAKIGEYFPRLALDSGRVQQWRQLNSFSNRFCAPCKFRFVCAGGCPWHIVHQNKCECLPIQDEIDLAWNYYADKVMDRLNLTNLC